MPRETRSVDEIEIKRLGEKLRAIRQRADLTLDQMAAILGKAGVARRSRVSSWERESRTPSLTIVLRYARFAGISTDILLDDELDLPWTAETRSDSSSITTPKPKDKAT